MINKFALLIKSIYIHIYIFIYNNFIKFVFLNTEVVYVFLKFKRVYVVYRRLGKNS